MRKIFFITLFFLFSKLLDAQCDSLSFNNDVKELYKFGLENINKKNVSNDKLYYENFYQLFKKTDELGLKYKNCSDKFYYNGIKYLDRYFLYSFILRGCFIQHESFDKRIISSLSISAIMNSKYRWIIELDSIEGLRKIGDSRFCFLNEKGSPYLSDSLCFLYRNYFDSRLNYGSTMPNLQNYLLTGSSLTDVYSTKINDKAKKYLMIISIFLGMFIIMIIIVFLQLRKNKKQNKLIIEQKSILEYQKQEITDSINYSKRIQTAILPDLNDIKQNLNEFFILYQPKDIVSGDFYYFNKVNSDVFIAAADCTGHGVPGAFMSLVGSKELKIANAISNSPAQILKHLNNGVKDTLRQNHIDGTKDGMDIALVRINGTTVTYSAANRPLWILKNGSDVIEETKATKTAIAGFTEDNFEFDEHEIDLAKGDTIYLFSDGYADQFGGDKQKKMTTKRFREFLLSVKDKSMNEQQLELVSFFNSWQDNTEQVDDLLIIGIRL